MKLQTISENCSGCGACRLICALANFEKAGPSKALLYIEARFPAPGDYRIHVCDQCGACADVCPVEAIVDKDGVFVIEADECIGCWICADECPQKVIIKLEKEAVAAKCVSCGECADICPRDALSMAQNVPDAEGV